MAGGIVATYGDKGEQGDRDMSPAQQGRIDHFLDACILFAIGVCLSSIMFLLPWTIVAFKKASTFITFAAFRNCLQRERLVATRQVACQKISLIAFSRVDSN